MNAEALKVLEETKSILQDGWTRGDLYSIADGTPRYCLVGALGKAKGLPVESLLDEGKSGLSEGEVYDAANNSDGSGVILAEVIIDYLYKIKESTISYASKRVATAKIEYIKESPHKVFTFNDWSIIDKSDIMNVLDLAIEKAKVA